MLFIDTVPRAPIHKFYLSQFSSFVFAPVSDEADSCAVVREQLQMAISWIVCEVCTVEGKEEGSQCVRLPVSYPYILGFAR